MKLLQVAYPGDAVFNREWLLQEVAKDEPGVIDVNSIGDDTYAAVYIPDNSPYTVQQWSTLISALDGTQKTDDQISNENKKDAIGVIRYYTEDLRTLGPAVQSYVLLGRAYALNDGQNDATIFAIQSKQDAENYITSKAEWAGLPAAEKAWWADHLNSMALVLQAIIALT